MTTPPFESTTTERFQPAPPEPGPVPQLDPVPVPVSVRPRPSGGSNGSRLLNLALGAALLIAAAGVAFAAGRATAPAGTTGAAGAPGGASVPGAQGGNGGFGNDDGGLRGNGSFPAGVPGDGDGGFRDGLGAFGGGLTIEGTVDSVTAGSVTIKLASGRTITVGLDSSTTYHQQTSAAAGDVQAGKSVILRLAGGFRPDGNGSGTLGTASDVTVVP